ncbi:MAG: hypothetical protein HY056_10175 [Proteobacteria bacterium]|nr:hypothetical protein [Pseudomonadota bacterium]
MTIRLVATALAFCLLVASTPPPAIAQQGAAAAQPAADADKPAVKRKRGAAKSTDKKLTPQQQKMKDCAGKWREEKKLKDVKGRAAYNKFMSGCLKA